jgi:uncharacterized protein VirK/YbjX
MLSLSPGLTAVAPLPQASDSDAQPGSALSLWSASARAHASKIKGRLRRRTRFLVRALSQPVLTRTWLARLVQPDVAPLWAARPRLAQKLQRPYVCCAWNSHMRLAALLKHYDFLCSIFAPEVRKAIYGDGVDLLRIAHPETGSKWDIQMFYHDRFEREGEITLAIRDVGTGVMLAGLTFCLAQNTGDRIAIIGGMQAGSDPRTLDLIRDATKGFFGMRPKALLVWCLQQLAQLWQLTQIQAVGDAQHVWRHWMKQVDIAACYDDFWRESDGRTMPGGGSWELPLKFISRPRGELKPSRRKTYERRYVMLDGLGSRLIARFAALAPGPQARTALESAPETFVCPPRNPPEQALKTSPAVKSSGSQFCYQIHAETAAP